MKLIDHETLMSVLEVAKTASKFLGDQAVDVVNQALNYALFEATIHVLQVLSLYLIYYIISKFIVAAENANAIEATEQSLKTANAIKTFRHIFLVLFTGIVLYNAKTSVLTIGKITISPKLYLLEEGSKILEKLK